MSIFYCHHCGQNVDSDYKGCEIDPSDISKEVCTECAEEIAEDLKSAKNPAWDMKEHDYL